MVTRPAPSGTCSSALWPAKWDDAAFSHVVYTAPQKMDAEQEALINDPDFEVLAGLTQVTNAARMARNAQAREVAGNVLEGAAAMALRSDLAQQGFQQLGNVASQIGGELNTAIGAATSEATQWAATAAQTVAQASGAAVDTATNLAASAAQSVAQATTAVGRAAVQGLATAARAVNNAKNYLVAARQSFLERNLPAYQRSGGPDYAYEPDAVNNEVMDDTYGVDAETFDSAVGEAGELATGDLGEFGGLAAGLVQAGESTASVAAGITSAATEAASAVSDAASAAAGIASAASGAVQGAAAAASAATSAATDAAAAAGTAAAETAGELALGPVAAVAIPLTILATALGIQFAPEKQHVQITEPTFVPR